METFQMLDTEQCNPATRQIDRLSTLEMVQLINQEDHRCAEAVSKVLPEIAKCVDVIEAQLRQGGRLFYAGAGTSGRLGVIDAAECPPTYGVPSDLVNGLIAGGPLALLKSVEGAEDSREMGKKGSGRPWLFPKGCTGWNRGKRPNSLCAWSNGLRTGSRGTGNGTDLLQ